MKVNVQKENNRVIASGSTKGRKVKAVVVCHPEDEFNTEKGIELATKKYKIREKEVNKSIHEGKIKGLKSILKWVENEIVQESKIVDGMTKKIEAMKAEYHSLINE